MADQLSLSAMGRPGFLITVQGAPGLSIIIELCPGLIVAIFHCPCSLHAATIGRSAAQQALRHVATAGSGATGTPLPLTNEGGGGKTFTGLTELVLGCKDRRDVYGGMCFSISSAALLVFIKKCGEADILITLGVMSLASCLGAHTTRTTEGGCWGAPYWMEISSLHPWMSVCPPVLEHKVILGDRK